MATRHPSAAGTDQGPKDQAGGTPPTPRECPAPGAPSVGDEAGRPEAPPGRPGPGHIPNVSLSRAARTGKPTEDELLLQRARRVRPVARIPEQAEFTRG